MAQSEIAYIEVGGRRIAYRARSGSPPTLVVPARLRLRHGGCQGPRARRFRRAAGPRDAPAGLFGHRLERREVRGRHAGAVAGGSARRGGPAERRAADRRRLVDGRLDWAAPRAAPAGTSSAPWSASPPRRILPTGASRPSRRRNLPIRGK